MDAPNKEFTLAGSLEELKAKGRLVVHGSHREYQAAVLRAARRAQTRRPRAWTVSCRLIGLHSPGSIGPHRRGHGPTAGAGEVKPAGILNIGKTAGKMKNGIAVTQLHADFSRKQQCGLINIGPH
jgi:hypothetical protein